MVYRTAMPTNKLWIEHTERAAWDSVEALRERLLKAEARLQALTPGVERVPELLDLLDTAKQKYAADAQTHDEIVAQLLRRLERLQTELDAVRTPEPTVISFSAPPPRARFEADDAEPPTRRSREEDEPALDLATFTQTLLRHGERSHVDTKADLERLLAQAEDKVDELPELEGAALREAAVELALLAARIHAGSRERP